MKFRELFVESKNVEFYAPDGEDYSDDDAMDYLSDEDVLKEIFRKAEKDLKVKITKK